MRNYLAELYDLEGTGFDTLSDEDGEDERVVLGPGRRLGVPVMMMDGSSGDDAGAPVVDAYGRPAVANGCHGFAFPAVPTEAAEAAAAAYEARSKWLSDAWKQQQPAVGKPAPQQHHQQQQRQHGDAAAARAAADAAYEARCAWLRDAWKGGV